MAIIPCNALTGKHISMRLEFNSGSLLSGQLKVQDAPALGFWASSGSLDAALAGTVNAIGHVSGNLVSEVSIATSGRTTIQNDVNANQVVTDAVKSSLGAIVNGSGVYQAFSGLTYINGNANLAVDLSDLDTALAAVQADVNQNESDADALSAAKQVVLDKHEAAMGAAFSSGGDYVAHSGKTYINGNSNVTEDLIDLDAAIVSREAAISASYSAQIGATRASTIAAILDGAPGALDTLNELAAALGDDANYATTITNALAAKATVVEVNALETSLGGLVNASGVYQAFSGKNYINGNTTIHGDLVDLDAAIAAEQVVLDKHEAAMGAVFSAGGDYVAHSSKNYINGNTSVTADLIDLDQAIKDRADGLATLEGHLDNSNGFRVSSAAGNYRMSWGTNKPEMTMTLNADGETIDVCFNRGA